ncbi:carotenoid 1,2-hydratase [Hydrogenophaga sp.]|uniref:lipocalin-like domain-containing protein n=1 Tax=Hydrogenophaga sp. TaxID=1904254 RepID=UPI002618D469|nr:carotenoid 1,2-hydratase [Hydrogenophaga sp.]MDM7950388.1 carotenoid 1,2-hydratase [Hydrogenophaga sp.]
MSPGFLGSNRRQWLMGASGLLLAPAFAETANQQQHQAGSTLTPRPLRFPRDHGTHNETRTEWWYLTGHAKTEIGRTFGFQVTFFRSRVDAAGPIQSRLAARQLLFAHAAISDLQGQQLLHDERIARWNGEPPLQTERGVFARVDDMQVVLRDWFIERDTTGVYRTSVSGDGFAISLRATPTQALLLQGDRGFSRKGPDPSQASFYVTHPQLAVQGALTLSGQRLMVTGRAWLDHEWSEAILHPEAVGWDWIGMNLDNGDSLTAFELRRADGSTVWAGGSYRTLASSADPLGARSFAADEVRFTPRRFWTSPLTRARYPVEWQVDTPSGRFTVRALLDAQELDSRSSTGTVYWEGLSDLLDAQGQRVGRGYLEMTGYAQRLVL